MGGVLVGEEGLKVMRGKHIPKPYPLSSGEEERTPCTVTKDTQCQCKPGTFHEEDSPEFCQKCSTG